MSNTALVLETAAIIRIPQDSNPLEVARDWNSTRDDQIADGKAIHLRRCIGIVRVKAWKLPHVVKGRRGGEARAASLTPERRSDIARKAAQARWNR